ncbi:MAG TPA: nucleotidyltransferase family protein, partial [Blastocatellia bacterium]|nr:nucleotidyltransferase family protein [Blastocatellia bacterium]
MNWTATDKLLLSAFLPSDASRARLRQLITERNDEIDWPRAFERARYNFISTLLRFNLVQSGLIRLVPKDQQQAFETESLAWAAKHLAYMHRVRGFIQTLNERGIKVLPLKGAALMLGNYYPIAGLRVAADLDLLIDESQVIAADAVAVELGFGELAPHQKQTTRAAQPLTHERRHLPTRCDAHGIVLELHYRAFHNPRQVCDFGFAEMASRAVQCEVEG